MRKLSCETKEQVLFRILPKQKKALLVFPQVAGPSALHPSLPVRSSRLRAGGRKNMALVYALRISRLGRILLVSDPRTSETRTSAAGLDLSHQRRPIDHAPVVGDLAVLDLHELHDSKLDLLA